MYHRILVPLDGSGTAERGLREAIGMAIAHKAELHLLHVVDDFPLMVEMSSAINFQETRAHLSQFGEVLLAKAKGSAEEAGVRADIALRELTSGRVADAIVEEATNAGCDLIVIGSHGRRGFSRLALGSEAERVARSSPVPVLLVHQGA